MWIIDDPVLKEHFVVEDSQLSWRPGEGEIRSKCNLSGVTPAYIYATHAAGAARWWPKYGNGELFWQDHLHAEDPEFFEKLRLEILRAHDFNPNPARCGMQLWKN